MAAVDEFMRHYRASQRRNAFASNQETLILTGVFKQKCLKIPADKRV
jgi:hypothetical protein